MRLGLGLSIRGRRSYVSALPPAIGNLSDPATWTRKVGAGGGTSAIDVTAGTCTFKGGGSSNFWGVYIPLTTVAGTTYTLVIEAMSAYRVAVGTANDGATILASQNGGSNGTLTTQTRTFVATSSTTVITLDKAGTTDTTVISLSVLPE